MDIDTEYLDMDYLWWRFHHDCCYGKNSCHGSQVWCIDCGDVTNICDFPECDIHQRWEEVEHEIREVTTCLKLNAKSYFDLVYSNRETFFIRESKLEELKRNINLKEREYINLQSTLDSYKLVYKMVPRKRIRDVPPDTSQNDAQIELDFT